MPEFPGWKPALGLFALVFCAYGYFYQAGGWNQNSRFDMVRAGVESGTARIDDYHRNTGDKACRGPRGRCVKAGPKDHYYCDKAPGVSWLSMPSYAILYWTMGEEKLDTGFLAGAAYVATLTSVAIPSALSVVALFWCMLLFGLGRRAALGVSLGYGLATLALPYSTLLYGHQLAAALLLVGFVGLITERKGARTWGKAGLFAIGLCLGTSVVVEYPSAVPLIAICVYAATWMRPWKRLVWLAAGIAVPGLVCAAYHWIVFGGPATLPYEFSTQPHRSQGFFMGLGVPKPSVLSELVIGRYRGLFYSAPWLLAALPGAVLLFRRRAHRAELYVSAVVVVFVFWLNASLVDWQGGWTMGPRYLITAIPFLVIMSSGLLVPDAFGRPRLRLAISALVLAVGLHSAHMMLMATAVKPEVPAEIKTPFESYLRPNFANGKLSISTQGIDMPHAPMRAPTKAWNLGQKFFGLKGRGSLAPLFALQFVLFVWLWRRFS